MKKAVIYSRVSTTDQDNSSQTKDLQKEADSIFIEVTDENSYYSGEDTDVTIFGRYTTEAFFAAMMQNKQLNEVKADTK